MYGLDLFSGIGGLSKALDGYVKPIAYCEIEPYARAVLLSRMSTGDLPIAPIWDDVRGLHGAMLPKVDIIYGGFPCQDLSVNGYGKGLEGERSSLFFQIARLSQEIKPPFIFLENVPNIRTKGLSRVVRELADIGYDSRWCSISAKSVGAKHIRRRWFLLAHSIGSTYRTEDKVLCPPGEIIRVHDRYSKFCWGEVASPEGEILECYILGSTNGIPHRVDRVKAMGNAVVPAQAREAFERLMGLK